MPQVHCGPWARRVMMLNRTWAVWKLASSSRSQLSKTQALVVTQCFSAVCVYILTLSPFINAVLFLVSLFIFHVLCVNGGKAADVLLCQQAEVFVRPNLTCCDHLPSSPRYSGTTAYRRTLNQERIQTHDRADTWRPESEETERQRRSKGLRDIRASCFQDMSIT